MNGLLAKGDQFFAKHSIRKKIWVSFAIFVGVLIVVGVIGQTNMQANKKQLGVLVNDVQPAVVQSLQIVDELDRASASLGFYLLSKEDVHKKEYLFYMDKITTSVVLLSEMKAVRDDPETALLVETVAQSIKNLQVYKERMMLYASNEMENIKAMKFAATEVNPRVLVLLGNLQDMITSEKQQKATPERKKLLLDIYALRTSVSSAVNELRLFLALRAQNAADNFKNYVEVVEKDYAKVTAYTDQELTFEQYEALDAFKGVYKEYFPLAQKLIDIHAGEDWRLDAYTIRKEISPLVRQIQEKLNKVVKIQYDYAVVRAETLTAEVNRTQYVVGGIIASGLLLSILIGFMLVRAITVPVDKLKGSAAELAAGNLDQQIDTNRADELGSLAQSFADMRDSIRKKIEDLRTLNVTGEIMASMHEPMKVLEKALMVMRSQTNVAWGSVYLFNKETDQLEVKTFHPRKYENDDSEHKARTFRIGEGVAGRAVADKHVIHIPNTLEDETYVAHPGEENTPRAVICVPMIDNDEVFGLMNFSGEVGKVKFDSSDIEFAETIARMAVVSFKNINMLNVIEEQNRTLEQKVEQRTAALAQKTKDINNMLQNMHQGIFTIMDDGTVHPEYSAYLESIIENNMVAGERVMDLLFASTTLGSNATNQIDTALQAILGEDEMMFDFNKHCLVNEFTLVMKDGREKILELDWDPLLLSDGTIEKVMVTVRDVTELRGLQAEAEKQKWELEVIGQILAATPNKFVAFAKDANRFLDENEALIKNADKPSADDVALLFRNMHTVKGNARTYGFHGITDAAHEAEGTYDKYRKDPQSGWEQAAVLEELYKVRECVQTYEVIYREKLAGNDADGVFVDKVLIDKLQSALSEVNENNVNELRKTVSSIRTITQALGTESITGLLDSIIKSMPDLAEKLGKIAPEIVIHDHDIRLAADIVPIMKNVFTHGFRNSVDHGIETAEERKASGKAEKGTIVLDVHEEEGNIVLSLSDDGRGLAIAKLKQKAIEKGLFNEGDNISDAELAELIFHSGLSTAEKVSDVSGRGVGMDAIRKFVENLGGTVEVRFKGEANESGEFIAFESRIIIPKTHSVKVA